MKDFIVPDDQFSENEFEKTTIINPDQIFSDSENEEDVPDRLESTVVEVSSGELSEEPEGMVLILFSTWLIKFWYFLLKLFI